MAPGRIEDSWESVIEKEIPEIDTKEVVDRLQESLNATSAALNDYYDSALSTLSEAGREWVFERLYNRVIPKSSQSSTDLVRLELERPDKFSRYVSEMCSDRPIPPMETPDKKEEHKSGSAYFDSNTL